MSPTVVCPPALQVGCAGGGGDDVGRVAQLAILYSLVGLGATRGVTRISEVEIKRQLALKVNVLMNEI